MAHNLFLSTFEFKVKKNKSDSKNKTISVNEFLSLAYPNKNFAEGFVQDIVDLFDKTAVKSNGDTHGAALEENKDIQESKRIFDFMLDGGLTGIKQFLVNEDGTKTTIENSKIVGPKFFVRFFLPSGSNSCYLFLQKYSSLSIKPLLDTIIKKVLENHGLFISGKLTQLTTKKRQELFFQYARLKEVSIVEKSSHSDTGVFGASKAFIKLSSLKHSKDEVIDEKQITKLLKRHGISIKDFSDYDVQGKYLHQVEDYKEEKTLPIIGVAEEDLNFVPNLFIPAMYRNEDNHPIFEKMQKFVDIEIDNLNKESKIK